MSIDNCQVHDQGLSQSTRGQILWLVRSILNHGVEAEVISKNPAADVKPPNSGPRRKVQVRWSEADVGRFLDGAQRERMYPALFMLIVTGLRRGELLGLKWEDLDATRSVLRVRRSLCKKSGGGVEFRDPKTDNGMRDLALSPTALNVLIRHRDRQNEERSNNELWTEYGLIFPTECGSPFHPDNLRRPLKRSCKRAGLEEVRIHDLRHLNASLMLSSGVDEKVLSERLGHSDPSITRSIYQHTFEDQHRVAALALDNLVGGLTQEPTKTLN